MRFGPAILATLAVLVPSSVLATPGSLLDDSFPDFSSQGTVEATALADDGGVFVWGRYRDVDGVARPGLAKLDAGGRLDETFAPVAGPAEPTAGGIAFSLGPFGSRPRLFALPAGELMVIGRTWWELRKADGTVDDLRFPDLPRSDAPVPCPQFRTAERLYLVAGPDDDHELRAYFPVTGARDPSFLVASDLPEPPFEATPAAGGAIWVLGKTPGIAVDLFGTYASHTLYRLTSDGAVDPAFEPRELTSGYEYFLRPAPDGGFRLLSHYLGRYRFSPAASHRSLRAETFDADGTSLGSVAFSLSFAATLASVAFQGPDLAITPALDSTHFHRSDPGGQLPDPGFSIPLASPNQSPSIPRVTHTLDRLVDGRLLAGGTRRFLADGSPDPTWHQARLGERPVVSHLLPLPDGSVLVGGDFDRADGAVVPGLCRLRPDGTRDPSFALDVDGRFLSKVLPWRDGEFLALFTIPVTDATEERSELVRLDARGSLLGIWPPVSPDDPWRSLTSAWITDFDVQSNGAVFVQRFHGGDVPRAWLQRWHPDGTYDADFGGGVRSDLGAALFVLDDDSYFSGSTRFSAEGELLEEVPTLVPARVLVQLADRSVIFAVQTPYVSAPSLQRWDPEDGLDPDMIDPFISLAPASDPYGTSFVVLSGVQSAARDKLVVRGSLRTAAGRQSLVRLHANGRIDPTFRLPRVPSPITIHATHAPGDGSLWIAGDFATLGGEPRSGLARLADSSADGYEEWIAAAAAQLDVPPAMLAPEADLDGDGACNYLEFAAASDPVFWDATQANPKQVGPRRWRVFCNPEAPGLTRRIETSRDLVTWTPARADEVRIESNAGCLTWSLLPGHPGLFSRVRVE